MSMIKIEFYVDIKCLICSDDYCSNASISCACRVLRHNRKAEPMGMSDRCRQDRAPLSITDMAPFFHVTYSTALFCIRISKKLAF